MHKYDRIENIIPTDPRVVNLENDSIDAPFLSLEGKRETFRSTHIHTQELIKIQRQKYRQVVKLTRRQTDRKTDRQTDRLIDLSLTHTLTLRSF